MRKSDILFNNKTKTQLLKEGHLTDASFLMTEIIFTTFAGKYFNKTNFWAFNKIQSDFFKELYKNEKIYFYYNQLKDECYIYTKISNNTYNDILNNIQITLNDDELISVRWDNNPYRYFAWLELTKELTELEKIFKLNAITDMKKYMLYVRDHNPQLIKDIEEEILTIKPFIIQREITDNHQLAPELEDLTATSQKTNLSMSNIYDWFNWRANLLGWTTAQQQKLERKTFAEGQIDLSNTLYLDRITKTNLAIFAYEVKQKWNKDLDFSDTVELEAKDLESGQPIQQQNKGGEIDEI